LCSIAGPLDFLKPYGELHREGLRRMRIVATLRAMLSAQS
jgi:hypothetical protein